MRGPTPGTVTAARPCSSRRSPRPRPTPRRRRHAALRGPAGIPLETRPRRRRGGARAGRRSTGNVRSSSKSYPLGAWSDLRTLSEQEAVGGCQCAHGREERTGDRFGLGRAAGCSNQKAPRIISLVNYRCADPAHREDPGNSANLRPNWLGTAHSPRQCGEPVRNRCRGQAPFLRHENGCRRQSHRAPSQGRPVLPAPSASLVHEAHPETCEVLP